MRLFSDLLLTTTRLPLYQGKSKIDSSQVANLCIVMTHENIFFTIIADLLIYDKLYIFKPGFQTDEHKHFSNYFLKSLCKQKTLADISFFFKIIH